jgi:hypothetical protein
MRQTALTLAAAILTLPAASAQPPQNGNVRVVGGPPLQTLPPPGLLPSNLPAGSALSPWLTPPPGATPPSPKQELAKGPSAGSEQPTFQRFDSSSLRLKHEAGQWQLWSGALLIKDFGPAEANAYEALQVFRDLRVNGRGSIGGMFEYWLTDGRAPSALTRHRQVVPFDPATLRVEQMTGNWVLRDGRIILFNFGHSQTDAQQALAVCKHYEFNQLGYVGHPVPALKYLMKDPEARPVSGPQPIVPASARMQSVEMPHPRLALRDVGEIGDRVPLDAVHLDLRREGPEWVLYAGRSPLSHYGVSERDARMALEALQQFRVTELCRVGESGFGFFLSNGRPPQGTTIGTAARPLRTELLNVRQVNKSWAVCEGQRTLFAVGEQEADARHVLAAIREFHFDHVIPIDPGRSGHLYLFVKTRY